MKRVSLVFGSVVLVVLIFTLTSRHSSNPPESAATVVATNTINSPLFPSEPGAESVVDNPARTTDTQLITQKQLWREAAREGEYSLFHGWTERYIGARNIDEKNAMIAEGIALASERRQTLADLIRNVPERALEQAVPYEIRQLLPSEVTALLEEQVSGYGQLAVLATYPEPGGNAVPVPVFRTATIGDRTFEAFVYGRRLGEPTRNRIPLHGIAIDDLMAVSANPVRLLDADEASKTLPQDAICSVSALPVTVINEPTAVEIGGEVNFLCRPDHANSLNDRMVAAESGGPNPELDPSDPQPSTYTEGQKNLLMIRVDFDDLPGVPVADTTTTTIVSNVNSFYTEMSYGRASFRLVGQGSDITPTLRMPQPAAYYGTNNFYATLRTHARNAATSAGYTLSNYQFDVICMGSVPGWTWAGLGYIGAPGSWVRNSFSTSGNVTAHELGHNFGVHHANFWDTDGKSIIGTGTNVEYGDPFDNMGASSSIPNGHFNARNKRYIDWLKTNEMQIVSASGTYRIYAHDNANSPNLRALRITKNINTNYWVEFRQKFTSNKWLMNGAGLRWADNGNQQSLLLDTTPGTADDKNDSAILIGRTFTDKQGIHITPIGKGGTIPESLDVVVNLGTFPSNLPPTISISASATNASSGQTLTFTASASDPNGDTLAYFWDFGDGNFTNGPSTSKSWSTGEYVVRCEVTDMKGGVASAYKIIRVGSPTTFQISGTVTSVGAPVHGVRVFASSLRMTWTDSYGAYSLVGLPAGTYTIGAKLDGYEFAPSEFSNPVTVGPNAANRNFFDSQGAPFITLQPKSQTNFLGATLTLSSLAAGASPLRYQWQFNQISITNATNSNYVIANAQPSQSGAYRLIVTNALGSATSQVATITIQDSAMIQTIFADNFDTNTSGNWILNSSSADTRATFNYNYANDGIPSAPRSTGGTTRGVKFEANMTAGAIAAVNISPTGQSFTGDFKLRFDMWINANGPFPGGGTGSSEFLTAGVGTSGTTLQWASSQATGHWFAVDGEGGTGGSAAADFRAYSGTSLFSAEGGTYAAGTASNSRSCSNTYYHATFPGGQTAPSSQQQVGGLKFGAVGLQWRDVLINKQGNTVEWFIDGLKIATINNATFNANNIFIGYWDAFSSVSDNAALSFGLVDNLRVERTIFAPVISAHPQDRTVNAGQNVTFNVSASGTSPTFQWQFNGTNIANATASSYSLTNVQPASEGFYSVIVSNAAASVISDEAELIVRIPPTILAQPVGQTVFTGQSILFTVEAEGSEPMTYQWKRNGTNFPGAITSRLALSQVQHADAGNYTVAITNAAGGIVSGQATLTVNAFVISGESAGFSDGQFGFTVTGPDGQSVIIEVSENLEQWIPVQTNTFSAEPFVFSDSQSGAFTNRFYRVRLP